MTRLRLTISPYEGETSLSIISRLARRNGASFVQDFCSDMGVHWRDAANGDTTEIQSLARLSGLPSHMLKDRSVTRMDDAGYMLNGQFLTSKSLGRRELRVCPRCLCENDRQGGEFARHGRLEWLVSSYRTCHIHRTPMLTLPDANYPRCHHDFIQRVRDHWQTILRAEQELVSQSGRSQFEAYIASRVRGDERNDPCDDLDLDLMCRLSDELGVVLEFGASAYPSKLTLDEMGQAAEAGFLALSGGPDKLYSAFQAIRAASTSTVPGFQADFGVLARRIERIDHSSSRYAGFIDQLTDFAFTHYPYAKGDILFGRECSERRVHNLASAAETHGLNYSRMWRIAVGLGLGTTEQAERIQFSAVEHDRTIAEYAACLSPKRAAESLGIRGEMLNRLVNADLIAPRFQLTGLVPVYHPEDLSHLTSFPTMQAELVETLPHGYANLTTIGVHAKCRFEEVMRLALDGKLNSLCRMQEHPKLDELYVSLDDLRDQLEEPTPSGFTRKEAKRLLGVNSSTIAWLVRQELLPSTTVRHHRHRRPVTLISQQGLVGFLKEYATLGMMASAAHTQAKHVAAKLAKARIYPLDLDDHLSKIYVRTPKLEKLFDPGWSPGLVVG